jgi:hypothetical protein
MEIDADNISDYRLKMYYENIVSSLIKDDTLIFGITIDNDRPIELADYFIAKNLIKFVSGAFWWLLLFIICFFIKQNTIAAKIFVQIFVLVIAFIFGILGAHIPSFSPWIINILGFPIIQLLIIILIVVAVNNMKKK